MSNAETSYIGLFQRQFENGSGVAGIEIPMLQRDYAQGRPDDRTKVIRDNFLSALVGAITTKESLSLDFVYGDVKRGVLVPLDGQQRLTTLYLLHWYVGSQSGNLRGGETWLNLSYATRASSRMFCECLKVHAPNLDGCTPSEWLNDQPWFLHSWAEDATIRSMLTVLDEIQEKLRGFDISKAWVRLTEDNPAGITFHVLAMEEIGLDDDIYIKMNSRGKALTEFELFKARFERMLESTANPRARDFAHKIDGDWMDLFWRPGRSAADVDSALVRYLRYLTDVATWRAGIVIDAKENLDSAGLRIYGAPSLSDGDANAGSANVDLLFDGFETWADVDTNAWFAERFVAWNDDGEDVPARPVPLRLFGASNLNDCNLFIACCQAYGASDVRRFGIPDALQLFGVLVHRWKQTSDVDRRLRVVRNLIAGSSSELRADRMPSLIADVQCIMERGVLTEFTGFNDRVQGADEREKSAFVEQNPQLQDTLFALEDHPLLRGCLVAFDLDAETFESRAAAFSVLFNDESILLLITGALLAAGDYSIRVRGRYNFGSSHKRNQEPWREVFTAQAREDEGMGRIRRALGLTLDHVAHRSDVPLDEALKTYIDAFITKCETNRRLDWRYYFVKYDVMRQGASGKYVPSGDELGYSVCMLNKTQLNSYYRDPYLDAVRANCKTPKYISDEPFTGYQTNPRRLRLERSDIDIESIQEGWRVRIPEGIESRVSEILHSNGARCEDNGTWLLPVEQVANDPLGAEAHDSKKIDTMDRIQLAASFLDILVDEGY